MRVEQEIREDALSWKFDQGAGFDLVDFPHRGTHVEQEIHEDALSWKFDRAGASLARRALCNFIFEPRGHGAQFVRRLRASMQCTMSPGSIGRACDDALFWLAPLPRPLPAPPRQ